MARALAGPCLLILGVALALAGCSPAPMMERLPAELGGLPSGTPTAPRTGYAYPPVHDTAPPRTAAPLTDEQQLQLEKQLQKARQKQIGQAGDMKDPKDKAAGQAEDAK